MFGWTIGKEVNLFVRISLLTLPKFLGNCLYWFLVFDEISWAPHWLLVYWMGYYVKSNHL